MAKQVLKVTDFKGGLNSLSDARDIEDNEFSQNWNASLDKTGVVRYSGGGIQSLLNLPQDNTNQVNGFGLFRFTTDYSFNILDSDFNAGVERGTLAAVSSTTSVTLEDTDNVSTTADYYNNMTLFIYDGPGAGISREITDYTAARVATIDAFTGIVTIDDDTPTPSAAWEISQTHKNVAQTSTTGGSGVGCIVDIVTDASGNPTITIRNRGNGYAIDEEITFTDPNPDNSSTAVIIVATVVLTTASKYIIFPWKPDGTNFGFQADVDWITDGGSAGNPIGVDSTTGNEAGDYYLVSKTATITDNSFKNQGNITYKNSLTIKPGVDYTLSFDCRAQRRWLNYVSDGASGGSTSVCDQVPWVYLYNATLKLGLVSNGESSFFIDVTNAPSYDNFEDNYIDNGDFDDKTDTGINVNEGSGEAVTSSSVTVTVDGTSATTANSVNKIFFDTDGNYIGNCTARNSNTEIVFGGGISHALVDDDDLFTMDGWNEIDETGYLAIEEESVGSKSYGGTAAGTITLTSTADFSFNNLPSSYIYSDNIALIEEMSYHLNFVYASTDGVAYAVYDSTNDDEGNNEGEYLIPWTIRPSTGSSGTFKYVNEKIDDFAMFGKKQTQYVSFTVPLNDSDTTRNIQVRFAPVKLGSEARIAGVTLRKAVCDLNTMSFFGSGANPFLEDNIKEWSTYSLKFKLPEIGEADDRNITERDDWVFSLYAGMVTRRDGGTDNESTQSVYFDNIRLVGEDSDTITLLNDNKTTGSFITMYSASSSSWDTKFMRWNGLKSQPTYDYVNGMLKISDGNFANNNENIIVYRYDRKFMNKYFNYGWVSQRYSIPSAPNTIVTTESVDGISGTRFDCIEYINKLYAGLEYKNANKPPNSGYLDEYGHNVVGRLVPNGDEKWNWGTFTNWDMDDIGGGNGTASGILQRYCFNSYQGSSYEDDVLAPTALIGGQKGYKDSENENQEVLNNVQDNLSIAANGVSLEDSNYDVYKNYALNATIRGNRGEITDSHCLDDWSHNPISFWIQGVDAVNEDDGMLAKVGAGNAVAKLTFRFTHEFQVSQRFGANNNTNMDTGGIVYYKVRAWKVNNINAQTDGTVSDMIYNDRENTTITYQQLAADSIGLVEGTTEGSSSFPEHFPEYINNEGEDSESGTHKEIYIGKNDSDAGRDFKSSNLEELSVIWTDKLPDSRITKAEITAEGEITWTEDDAITTNDDIFITIEEIWNHYNRYTRCYSYRHGKANYFHGKKREDHKVNGAKSVGSSYITVDSGTSSGKVGQAVHASGEGEFVGYISSVTDTRLNFGGDLNPTGTREYVSNNEKLYVTSVPYHDIDSHSTYAKYSKIRIEKMDLHFYESGYDEDTSNVQSLSDDTCQANFNFGAPSGVDASGWGEGIFRLATTSVNLFEEESGLNENKLQEIGSSSTGAGTISLGHAPSLTLHISSNILRDKFKTQTKFYMKSNHSDIWYLQFYVDHKTGLLHSTTSSKKESGIIQPSKNTTMWTMRRESLSNYNEVDSYEAQTSVSQENAIVPNNALLSCRYKTSVVANNRLYVGNIKQNGTVFGDRMIKSPIGKYNLLPSTNFIDVAVNDGDEITALEFYKDKLLQFKKRKVFVINTSGDYEFLEDTFDNIGVQRQCQVTKTPMGIAWANSSGCFLYDGGKVINLIDGKLGTEAFQSQIVKNYWWIEDSYIPPIGYIKSTKKLLIALDVTSHLTSAGVPTMWQYDFVSQGWTFIQRKQKIESASGAFAPSNFINDENGDILWYSKAENSIYKWSDSPVTNTHVDGVYDIFTFSTKDYDFGNPAVRKKIYKVYVTFKSYDDSNGSGSDTAAHSNIKVYYATNGDFDTFTEFSTNSTNYDTTNGLSDGASSTEWITAELKPTSSINNIYSFSLKFLGTGNIPNRFEINDFSIVYRIKNVK